MDLYIVANFGMDDMSAALQSQMQEIGLEVDIKSAEAAATFAAIDGGESNANWVFYWWADPSGPFEVSNGPHRKWQRIPILESPGRSVLEMRLPPAMTPSGRASTPRLSG